MKKLVFLSLYLVCCFNSISLQAQTKHAVIVAIEKFQSPEIPTINSLNDVPFIKSTLLANGFEEKNIVCLENENAKKADILKAITSDLHEKIEKGDVVVLHFSTHGIGIKDIDGDEEDGYDETLICYDTPFRFPENYVGEKHLIDDEINIFLTNLRNKLGKDGQILLTVDACYSGTISRGNERFRSFSSPDDDRKTPTASQKSPPEIKTPGLIEKQAFDESNPASLIVISASSAHEANSETTDSEGNPVGSLSYAFSKAMQNKQRNSTYELLFDCIKSEMSAIVPRQKPQIEGNTQEFVFKNLPLSLKNENIDLYKAKTVLSDTTFILNAGGLAEIMEGSLIELVAKATKSSDSSLVPVHGKVISATEFESQILLSKPLTESQILQADVVIKSRSFAGLHQKVLLSVKNSEKIEVLLAGEKIIQFVKPEAIFSADLLVEERKLSKKETELILLYKNIEDTVFVKLPDTKPETIAEILKKKIISYAKSNYLRAISPMNPNLNVELKIIPIKYKETEDKIEIIEKYDEKSLVSNGGQLILKEGTVFILRAINKGTQKAYLSIINIQPDNNITLLLPDDNLQAENLFLNPNDSVDFEEYMFQVSPPYGADILKLIASQKPMTNLKFIFGNTQSRSLSRTTQANSPFEVLMNESINTPSRSLKKINVPVNDINVCTKIIQVVR